MNIEQFQQFKSKISDCQREADRAEGQLEGLMKKLRDEFECSSVEEGESKLSELDAKLAKADKLFDAQLKEFESKWKEQLRD